MSYSTWLPSLQLILSMFSRNGWRKFGLNILPPHGQLTMTKANRKTYLSLRCQNCFALALKINENESVNDQPLSLKIGLNC